MPLYVQYGCGLSAPDGWKNFDASPTLRLQNIPIAGRLVRKVRFPAAVTFGDIIKGLPGIKENSCDGVYCSHVLEHLALQDFRKALRNSYIILKQGGIFRCVLPDLEFSINEYIKDRAAGNADASVKFIGHTLLGINKRAEGLKEKTISLLGNSHHLWMWDKYSLEKELKDAGFSSVRPCTFNDSVDDHFKAVEDSSRFNEAIAFEAVK